MYRATRILFGRAGPLAALLALMLYATPSSVAAPPSNDNFADAAAVESLPFTNVVSVGEATTEPGEPGSQSRTVWYSFTPQTDLIAKVDLGGSDYVTAFLSIYRADSAGLAGLTPVASGWYGGPFTVKLQAGKTYYFQEGDAYPYGWVSTVGIHLQVVEPPPNDNFADAKAFTSVPFSDSPDLTAATIEPGEPMACGGSFSQSVWYSFTPTVSGGYGGDPGVSGVAVYTGTSLGDLSNVACSQWWGLAFHADAGKTYYLQEHGGGMRLDLLPAPNAGWSYSPGDPSSFDNVSFAHGNGYWDPTITDWAWDFGDGATSTGASSTALHRFAHDGDYNVKLTVTTVDQRTSSETKTVHVRTHDVAILSLAAPDKGKVGKPGSVTVGIGNTHYPESVQVDLYKITPSGAILIDMSIRAVGVMGPKKTVTFPFKYTFTAEDAEAGKVSFRAVATIQNARDAAGDDNVATSFPTLVTK